MRVTYYALRPVKVGGEIRTEGDLVPEAASWKYLSGYLQDGKLAPVLVATLPEEQQMMLLEWEEDQFGPEATSPAPESPGTDQEPEGDDEDDKDSKADPEVEKKGKVA